ncbi:MAG: hypothetical protein LQ347_000439 [Umbilicaria vellea]|nr:MAG: hypothetical protein LQ347_000439 [Umbilicaria vellea]
MAMEDDPFDGLLGLEDRFYDEGYKSGVADGTRAGHIEGRLFGLEKGFDKYMSMGKLHGRVTVWASRLQDSLEPEEQRASLKRRFLKNGRQYPSSLPNPSEGAQLGGGQGNRSLESSSSVKDTPLPVLPSTPRLEKHVQTLCALVEPDSLSTQNTEDAVANFDDRLKRARGKVKIIEKSIYTEDPEFIDPDPAVKRTAERMSSTD